MKFIKVKINEGGKVFMVDEKSTKEAYTDEENKLVDECCTIINNDLKLKKLFVSASCKILKDYLLSTMSAYRTQDTKARDKAIQTAVSLLKGLTMHMHVQVTLKKKEVKP